MSAPQIRKTQKKTFSQTALFLRKFSVIVAHYLNMVWINPNQVVLFRVFVFGGLSMWLFFSASYMYNVLWIGTIFLCYFFDLVDGDLARNYNKKTDQGKFLDEELDSVVVTSLVLTFALKFYFMGYEPLYVVGGITALFGIIGSSKMTNFFQGRFNTNCVGGNDVIEQTTQAKSWDLRSEFFYQLVTPKHVLMTLFSNFRYYLLIGVVTNSMHIAVLLYAIAINLRWMMLFICVWWYYTNRAWSERNVKLFEAMKAIERIE